MAYKIAIGSSDGIHVDLKFGEAKKFLVFEVEGLEYQLLEIRDVNAVRNTGNSSNDECHIDGCRSAGCSGNGNGCGGPADVTQKVDLIEDCRCIVCAKVGFQAQKQLERKAISVFDVECNISEALNKIRAYYDKLDQHKSLREKA